jgi:uncharacterized small protein (DUF1192 family)
MSESLEDKLNNRESLIGEAAKSAKYIERNLGVYSVAEEETRLAALNKQIETIEASPAIIDRLREQVDDENRRFELRQELRNGYWPISQVEDVITRDKEYINNVKGETFYDGRGLITMIEYALFASGIIGGERSVTPLADVEDVVLRLREIRKEAESGTPDIQKVDRLLAEFLCKRLRHFFATFDQRVEKIAQHIHDFYKRNPNQGKKYKADDIAVKHLKQDIYRTLPDVETSLQEVEQAMSSVGYKAKALARIGENISVRTHGPLGDDRYPFFVDDFKELGEIN